MLITHYSALDSCHYPKEQKCLVASGKVAEIGMVACPIRYPFGTKFELSGRIYTCEDRYNADLSDRLDIFVGYGEENHLKAKRLGVKIRNVKKYEHFHTKTLDHKST